MLCCVVLWLRCAALRARLTDLIGGGGVCAVLCAVQTNGAAAVAGASVFLDFKGEDLDKPVRVRVRSDLRTGPDVT